jgi:hypothetical protein
MFAPTISLEAGSRPTRAHEPQKKRPWGLAQLVKAPVAPLFMCLLTMSMAIAGHAQTRSVIIQSSSSPTAPINEGVSGSRVNATFDVSLSSPATDQVTVTLSTANGTAEEGLDFEARTNVPVVFNVGEQGPKTVSVPVIGDDVYEAGNNRIETFTLAATEVEGSADAPAGPATAFIRDDEAIPVIDILDPIPLVEGDTGTLNYNFTVTLSGPSADDITIPYTAIRDQQAGPSAATPGVDFQQPNPDATVFIPRGTREASLNIPVLGDTLDETTETFLVQLSNPTTGNLGKATAVGTITDNDGPSVRIGDAIQTEGQDFRFVVTLSAESAEAVSVNYTTRDNTATAPGDYNTTSGTIVFEQGVTRAEITVNTNDDNLVEGGDEFFTVELSGASGQFTFADAQGVGTIQDNEAPPIISIAPVSQLEGNSGTTTFTFQANLNTPSTQEVRVNYATSDSSTFPASAGNDYRPTSGTIRFTPGTTQQSFNVIVLGDGVDEDDERFTVTLSSAQNAVLTGGNITLETTGTILNDDGPVIRFDSTSVAVSEGGAGARNIARFKVLLNNESNHTVTVRYDTVAGTVNPASLSNDLTRATGTLEFPRGSKEATIEVTIKGDVVDEDNETFEVVLSDPRGGTLSSVARATGTIRDDDAAPIAKVADFEANEGNSSSTNFSFKISLDHPSAQTVTVNYATTGITATDDVDFVSTSGTATFNPGVTLQTVRVPVISDRLDEPTETFRLILSNPVNSRLSGTTFGTGTIRDDDATPQLSIVPSAVILEDTAPTAPATLATLNFTVSINAPSSRAVGFTFTTRVPTVNNGQQRPADLGDYQPLLNFRGTIPAGETSTVVGVSIRADELDEFDEYFNVTLSTPTNAVISRATSRGIILDDDDAGTVTLEAPSAENTAIEGARDAVFPVELSDPAGRDVKVTYTISPDGQNDRANPATDLAPRQDNNGRVLLRQTTGFITFRPGQTNKNIVITAIADSLDEATLENYRVTITRIEPADWTVENEADGTAASTIEDRNPGFTSFERQGGGNDGNESYNNDGNNGTDVILTGNQFRIGNVSQVRRVLFGVISDNVSKARASTDFEVVSDTQIRAKVPRGAVSGRIRIELTNGRILTPTGNNADRVFFINAVVTGFSPDRGLPRSTVVVIRGLNFRDPNNPVTGVRFTSGGATVPSNTNTAGVDPVVFKQNGESFIRATVPTGATTGPISVVTRNGTNYPPSLDNFTIDTASTGRIEFAETPNQDVLEDESGIRRNPSNPVPIAFYTLRLNPAIQNPTQAQVAPRSPVTVEVTISAPNGRLPIISSDSGRVVQRTGQRLEITFDAGTFQNKIINLVDAGDDIVGPAFTNAGFQAQTPVPLVLRARIIRSDDAFYPVPAGPVPPANDVTPSPDYPVRVFNRFDLHGLDTDIGANYRTTEDQNSPANITSFKLNLRNINNRVDVAPDGTAIEVGKKYSNTPQTPVINPDRTVNTDAEPTADVFLPFEVNDATEGLIRYYVMVPNGRGGFNKVYPNNDAVFRPTVTLIYAANPNRDEYYKYDHYIEVKGVDDDLQDGSISYQILLDLTDGQNPNQNSVDPEFLRLNLVTPFTLSNTDNEESTNGNVAGFIFTPTSGTPAVPRLTVNEAGSQDFFRVRLRTKPSGMVTLRLQTGDPSEVLLVDPTDSTRNTKVETLDLTFFPDSNGSNGRESRWDTPIVVRFAGVDDDNLDGNQDVTILTSTLEDGSSRSTTDSSYQSIDPLDPVVTNQDNESNGVTVTPRSLVVDEGGSDTFTVRLNTRPTGNVSINVSSDDATIANASVVGGSSRSRITFTPDNWFTPQSVTVRGVADNAFTAQRSTIIRLANASSSDVNFDNLDVPDVTVDVQNQTQAFLVEPERVLSTGLNTSEDGASDTFTVRLSNAPTATVFLTLTTSSGEATLSSGSNRGNTITLTFTPTDFGRTQTVTVTGVDDAATDGNVAFNINGSIQSTDPVYQAQSFPSIPGVNQDNDGTSTGSGITYAANGTYTVSFPYATSSSASGGLTQAQAFSNASGSGTPQFTLYKFNVAGQRDSRQLNGGSDFVVVQPNEQLQRGIGYRLVTGANDVLLNQPANGLQPFAGTEFSLALSWNNNFLEETPYTDNRRNGYNFIGFPFDPQKFNRVAFASSQVSYGSETYETVTEAAAAGIIDRQLFTVDAQGNLAESSDGNIRPYRAYFVRILRNDRAVSVKLRNPSK